MRLAIAEYLFDINNSIGCDVLPDFSIGYVLILHKIV